MVFSSLLFLFRFLPVFLVLYFLAPEKYRNGILFLASLIFYGWGEPVYIVLLLFSTLVDFWHGKLAGRFRDEGRLRAAGCAVASSVFLNLGLLIIFKYTDFILGTINGLTGSRIPLPGLALPIGISFYTFQTMSYTIDVYRGEAPVQKNLISFGAYVSMFPQLIAGPIVRYQTIAEELDRRETSAGLFASGVRRFLTGLGKKVLLANQAGALWTSIGSILPGDRSIIMVWMGILAFAFQIYFDFSGYSDMAIGLGRMLGFHFPENFRYPYISASITEFWRRWHISLGTWFREYVYIPLGGNQRGIRIQIRNILAVWLLTGIWHGASLNFLLWGGYFGLLLLLEKLVLNRLLSGVPMVLRRIFTFFLVLLGWVLFAFEDMNAGAEYLLQMAGLRGLPLLNSRTLFLLKGNLVLLAAAFLGSTPWPARIAGRIPARLENQGRWPAVFRALPELCFLAALFILSTACLVDDTYNPFLYFRF